MNEKVQHFFEEIKNKRVAFIGTGVSHNDLIELLLKKGISTTICDKRLKESMGDVFTKFNSMGADFILGEDYLNTLSDFDIIFRTPGMYFNSPEIKKARDVGCVVTSEMELFFDLCPCKIFAVTGSDGKSTTTTLISEMFKAEGKTVHFGGNIGFPLLCNIEKIKYDDVAVVELSSFQLISMRESPFVAAITNITPNHLNVHKTMDEYIEAKCNILSHQTAFSKSVLSYDNETTRNLSSLVRGELAFFSRLEMVSNGSFLNDNGMLCYNDYGKTNEIVDMHDIKIPGLHNVENFLTAIAVTWGMVKPETVQKVAKEFSGVEHRIEFVRELDGVRYYNDSIASSPTRVLAGLNSFDQKLIIIQGGSDKGISFEPMADTICEKVKLLILMGETADKIENAVRSSKKFNDAELKIVRVKSMDEAVSVAHRESSKGDIVSLSPACASFDMYRMFEERGNHFKSLVNAL